MSYDPYSPVEIDNLAAYVCRLVEALPASPQQTELSLAAAELRTRIARRGPLAVETHTTQPIESGTFPGRRVYSSINGIPLADPLFRPSPPCASVSWKSL